MKKATTKRERKYGKKNKEDDGSQKRPKQEPVKVMVDFASVVKFSNRKMADLFISKLKKEAAERGHPEPSCIIL